MAKPPPTVGRDAANKVSQEENEEFKSSSEYSRDSH
jgi:hypothetical protein